MLLTPHRYLLILNGSYRSTGITANSALLKPIQVIHEIPESTRVFTNIWSIC